MATLPISGLRVSGGMQHSLGVLHPLWLIWILGHFQRVRAQKVMRKNVFAGAHGHFQRVPAQKLTCKNVFAGALSSDWCGKEAAQDAAVVSDGESFKSLVGVFLAF